MVGFALSGATQMHLITTMICYQISFCCLEAAELALELVHFTFLEIMMKHLLFDDAITFTLDALTTFFLMKFKIFIKHLILASHGSETAIELDGLQ
jgi:hypothetical protein